MQCWTDLPTYCRRDLPFGFHSGPKPSAMVFSDLQPILPLAHGGLAVIFRVTSNDSVR